MNAKLSLTNEIYVSPQESGFIIIGDDWFFVAIKDRSALMQFIFSGVNNYFS